MQFVLFTDNLSDLSIAETCRAARRAGFDGLDLTLRPGGHVLPDNAEMGLAEARRTADAEGVTIPMASTGIVDVDSPHAETIFAAAAHYGVRRLKLGYWRYEPFGTLAQQVDATKAKLARIAKLAARYHVLPCVHCHSGPMVASGGAMLYLVLKDFSPDEVGAYVDPMHMTVEGGLSGWEMGLDLLAPWVALAGFKNFHWTPTGRDEFGQQRYRAQYVPLADGQAPLPEFVARLKQIGYTTDDDPNKQSVASLHSEYKGDSSFRKLTSPELLEQSAEDLRYIKGVFERVG